MKLSDEYIQKVVVSGNAEHNQTIVLKPYDENWPVLFEREKQRISTILKTKQNCLSIFIPILYHMRRKR